MSGGTYALLGLDKQTEQYLQVANHVKENLKTLERLLRERQDLLVSSDKKDCDRTAKEGKAALEVVKQPLVPARVDVDANQNSSSPRW